MTMTRPSRRTTLHFSQMGLTLGLTFIALPSPSALMTHVRAGNDLLVAVNDPATGQVVRAKLHHYPVLREDSNVVLTHFARDVREDEVTVSQLNTKRGIRKCLYNRAFNLNDTVFLGHGLRSRWWV